MRFFPVFHDLTHRHALLVGASPALDNKCRLLRAAGAHVRWFAAGEKRTSESGIDVIARAPRPQDLDGAAVVVAAAGDPLDAEISRWAQERGIPVNVVDRPELSSFITPAIVDRGEVVVAVGTGGAAPVLARRIREKIESLLPARIGEFATLLRSFRPRVAARFQEFSDKRKFWERAVDGAVAEAALAGRTGEAEALLVDQLARGRAGESNAGSVTIVGAGPGDPDLLTLKALRAISDADVIYYDELVTADILDRVRRDARRVFVGKRRGAPGIGQDEINRRMVKAARAGQRVVRLKGGDPFVFGRGGEELDYLRGEGIRTAVVPGVSAALGCAAEAELPLTLRNVATRLAVVTAHRADAGGVNWNGLGDPDTTVVIYMGLSQAAAVRDGLIAAGRDPKTPAAVLARGTWSDAKSVAGTLDTLPALAARAGEGPAIIVVGEVVRQSLPWRANAEQGEAAA